MGGPVTLPTGMIPRRMKLVSFTKRPCDGDCGSCWADSQGALRVGSRPSSTFIAQSTILSLHPAERGVPPRVRVPPCWSDSSLLRTPSVLKKSRLHPSHFVPQPLPIAKGPSVNDLIVGGEQGFQTPALMLPSLKKNISDVREAILSFCKPIWEYLHDFKPIFKTQSDEGSPDKLHSPLDIWLLKNNWSPQPERKRENH